MLEEFGAENLQANTMLQDIEKHGYKCAKQQTITGFC